MSKKNRFLGSGDDFNFPVCGECKHNKGDGTCKAFPEGIPEEILTGDNKHKKPLIGQGNNIIFEPKNK